MERVDYVDTFIAVANDCTATKGTPPPLNPENPSVVSRTHQMIAKAPYEFTSGDVIFTVWADRHEIAATDRAEARVAFYSKSQACMRSSDLASAMAGASMPMPMVVWLCTASKRPSTQSSCPIMVVASRGRQ